MVVFYGIPIHKMHILEWNWSSPIGLTEKKIAWSNLNLLCELTGNKRKAITQQLYRQKRKPGKYEDVADYIKNKYSIYVAKQSKKKQPPE